MVTSRSSECRAMLASAMPSRDEIGAKLNGQWSTVNDNTSAKASQRLLQVVPISPITRRKASFPPIGMLPVSRGRYCDRSWERLPLTIADITIPDDDAKIQHSKINTIPIGTLWYPLVPFCAFWAAFDIFAYERSTAWIPGNGCARYKPLRNRFSRARSGRPISR